jgi:carboxyl-terminal processing protease
MMNLSFRLLPMVLFICLSLACGGGVGSEGSVKGTVDDGLLKTQLQLDQRQVFELQVGSESYRYVKEVVDSSVNSYTEKVYVEGSDRGEEVTGYRVIADKVYIQSFLRGDSKWVYHGKGRRHRFDIEELPFDQDLEVSYVNMADGQTPAMFIKKIKTQWLGKTTFVVAGLESEVDMIQEEEIDSDLESDVSQSSTLLFYQHPELGVVYMDHGHGTEEAYERSLLSLEQNHGQLFDKAGSLLNKRGESLIVDLAEVQDTVHDSQLREIYELGLSKKEIPFGASYSAAFVEGLHYYHRYYLYGDLLPSSLGSGYKLKDYVEALRMSDVFTHHLPPSTQKSLLSRSQGERATIGMRFESSDGSTWGLDTVLSSSTLLRIAEIEPLTRVYHDGFQVGDVVTHIDGVSLAGLTLQKAIDLTVKAEGTDIEFKIERGGIAHSIKTAAEDHMARLLDGGILYLNTRSFNRLTTSALSRHIEKIRASGGFSKVILDLRGNGGGLLSAATELLDLMAPARLDGEVMFKVNPRGTQYEFGENWDGELGVYGEDNVVVLIDGNSASASELVSGALQYFGAATLIGETSYGKGIGQSTFSLVDGAGLWVPSIELLIGGERAYHNLGIQPDFLASGTVQFDNDSILQDAILFLETGEAPASLLSKAKPRLRSQLDPLLRCLNFQ